MTLTLPQPIAAYFAADGRDGLSVSECFTETAVVKDEGRTHQGRAAINRWKDDAAANYQYTIEPLKAEPEDGGVVITCHLVGSFPGSPIDLRFRFELDGDKISSLEIGP